MKATQITCGNSGAGLVLFALDEDGQIWRLPDPATNQDAEWENICLPDNDAPGFGQGSPFPEVD